MIKDPEAFKQMWAGLAADPVGTIHHAFGAEIVKESETEVAMLAVTLAKLRDGAYLPTCSVRVFIRIGEVSATQALDFIADAAAYAAISLSEGDTNKSVGFSIIPAAELAAMPSLVRSSSVPK